jgi:thiol-disulfide isomerase/thioredoxin
MNQPSAIAHATTGGRGIGLAAALVLLTTVSCSGLPGRGGETVLKGDMKIISKGEEVVLGQHLAAGKYTLFDFYADWCPPCWEVDPDLEWLAVETTNVAVRKINIIDWSTPVVRQHDVQDLPHFLLFDSAGALIASGDEALDRAKEVAETAPVAARSAGESS